jgi:hypothetical protein
MTLGLATAAILLTVLACELVGPRLWAGLVRAAPRARDRLLFGNERGWSSELGYDPGRERRAELRAGVLLHSCVNEEEWAMYRDLGFLRVSGKTPRYAYLIYPHKPIVAYRPDTGTMLSEYCVAFPDHSRPYGSARLPDSDDVLAKWMALTADEHRLIADANMHLPGRQLDPERVKRDLDRLARWEHERSHDHAEAGESGRGSVLVGGSGSVPVGGRNQMAPDGSSAGRVRLGAGSVRPA